jgi:hypothetical protein
MAQRWGLLSEMNDENQFINVQTKIVNAGKMPKTTKQHTQKRKTTATTIYNLKQKKNYAPKRKKAARTPVGLFAGSYRIETGKYHVQRQATVGRGRGHTTHTW